MTILLLLLVAAVAFGVGILRGESNAARREANDARAYPAASIPKGRHAASRDRDTASRL